MAFPLAASALSDEEYLAVLDDLEIRPTAKDAEELQNLIKIRAPKAPKRLLPKFEIPPFEFAAEEDDPTAGRILKVPLFYAREKFGIDANLDNGPWKRLPAKLTQNRPAFTFREGQGEIVSEALGHLREHNAATLELRAGSGKTILAIALALELGYVFAVVLPFKALIGQWVASFGRVALGEDAAGDAAVASGVIKIPSELSVEAKKSEPKDAKRAARRRKTAPPKTAAEQQQPQCVIALGERALGLSPELRGQIGTLIVDEVHKCCVPSWVTTLLAFSPKYVIALSATVERQDGAHRMTHLLAGPHRIYRIPDRPFKVVAYHTAVHIPETLNRITKLLDYTQYCADLAACEEFNARIVDVVMQNPERKFIALFKLVRHAEAIRDLLASLGTTAALMCGQRSRYVDCRVLCGTSNKIGTGFDVATSALEFDGRPPDTMILANGVTTWQNAAQYFGRVMRARAGATPVVVWMLTENSVSKKHLSKMKQYIHETSGEIVKISAPAQPVLDAPELGKGSSAKKPKPKPAASDLESQMALSVWGAAEPPKPAPEIRST